MDVLAVLGKGLTVDCGSGKTSSMIPLGQPVRRKSGDVVYVREKRRISFILRREAYEDSIKGVYGVKFIIPPLRI